MNNAFEKYLYTTCYSEDLEWLVNDLLFYNQLKKPEVKAMYKTHIEWELSELKKLKTKLNNL